MWLSILVFAGTVVALVEASTTMDFGECGKWRFHHRKGNNFRSYLAGGMLFSHGEDKHLGVLVSPKHALVKTPDDKSFDIATANVKLSVWHLDETGEDSVVKSAKCGSYTVATVKKGVDPTYPRWNCLASSSEGDPLPGRNFLVGTNPETSYAEVTDFSFRPQRTCGKNKYHVTGGSHYQDYVAEEKKWPLSKDLPNFKLAMPNFILNEPGGRATRRIYGHFDKWVGGGEGQFKFTITRFTDAEIRCVQDVVDEKP